MSLRTAAAPEAIMAPLDRTATAYSDVIDCQLDADGSSYRNYRMVAVSISADGITGSGATMTPTMQYAASLTNVSAYDYTTAGDTWITLRYDTDDQVKLAHKFTTAASGAAATATIFKVKFYMKQVGSIAASKYVWATLEGDSSGPDGTAQQTSYKILANSISSTGEYITFEFRQPIALTAATVYYVVLQGDWTLSTTKHLAIYVDTVASGGTLYVYDSSWANTSTQSPNTTCQAIGTWTAVTPTDHAGSASAFTACTATIEDVKGTAHQTRYLDATVYGRYMRMVLTKSGTVSTCVCSASAVKIDAQYAE